LEQHATPGRGTEKDDNGEAGQLRATRLLTLKKEESIHMDTQHTHYDLLGLSMSASEKEIKTAFRKMALKHHPDKNDSLESAEIFKRLVEANDVLGDTSKRRLYDMQLQLNGMQKMKLKQQYDQKFKQENTRSYNNRSDSQSYTQSFPMNGKSSSYDNNDYYFYASRSNYSNTRNDFYEHLHTQPKRKQDEQGKKTGAEFQRSEPSQQFKSSYSFRTSERVEVQPSQTYTQGSTQSRSMPSNPIPDSWQKQKMQFNDTSGTHHTQEQQQHQQQQQQTDTSFTSHFTKFHFEIPAMSDTRSPPQNVYTSRHKFNRRKGRSPYQKTNSYQTNYKAAPSKVFTTESGRPSRTSLEENEKIDFIYDSKENVFKETPLEELNLDDNDISDDLVEIDEEEFANAKKESPSKKPKVEVQKENVPPVMKPFDLNELKRTIGIANEINLDDVSSVLKTSITEPIRELKVFSKEDLLLNENNDDETTLCDPPSPFTDIPSTIDELVSFSRRYGEYHEYAVNNLQLLRRDQIKREEIIRNSYEDLVAPVNQELLQLALEKNHEISLQLNKLEADIKGIVVRYKQCIEAFAKT
jgi:curved DNA-binding protein CbpA